MLKQSAASGHGLALPSRKCRPPRRRKSSIHPLLEEQLLEAADTAGKMQLRKLIEIVSRQYDAYENDRTSLETVMRLASDEATAMSERLERESVVRLQAILDHVKDGIISVDHLGRIESMNRTAERFFGVRQSDVMSDLIDTLIPGHRPERRRRPRPRGARDRAGDDALRPGRTRGRRQAPTRRTDAGRDPRQRDAEQAPADLHRLHPRHRGALEGGGGAQGQRGALPRAGRERPRGGGRARRRIAPLRGLQRQRGRLLQDVARGPAARRPGAGEPARAGRRHAVVRQSPAVTSRLRCGARRRSSSGCTRMPRAS